MRDGIRIAPFAEQRYTPWKNGGGETCELALHPGGAGHADFDWRLSRARIATEGPFSDFPGIDRTMCILDGEGLALDVEGSGTVVLGTQSAPYAFGADVPVHARLEAGAITNLNVMTRRGVWRHRYERLVDAAQIVPAPETRTVAVYAWGGSVGVAADGWTETLAAGDLVVMEAPFAGLTVSPATGARAFVVELAPV